MRTAHRCAETYNIVVFEQAEYFFEIVLVATNNDVDIRPGAGTFIVDTFYEDEICSVFLSRSCCRLSARELYLKVCLLQSQENSCYIRDVSGISTCPLTDYSPIARSICYECFPYILSPHCLHVWLN